MAYLGFLKQLHTTSIMFACLTFIQGAPTSAQVACSELFSSSIDDSVSLTLSRETRDLLRSELGDFGSAAALNEIFEIKEMQFHPYDLPIRERTSSKTWISRDGQFFAKTPPDPYSQAALKYLLKAMPPLIAVHELGLGPKPWLVRIGDQIGIAMQFTTGSLWKGDSQPEFFSQLSDSKLQVVRLQLRHFEKVLTDNKIEARDLQFLITKEGMLKIIDADLFIYSTRSAAARINRSRFSRYLKQLEPEYRNRISKITDENLKAAIPRQMWKELGKDVVSIRRRFPSLEFEKFTFFKHLSK